MTGTVVLGSGCFWCIEAAFKQLEGVKKATSGYAGGDTENPSYREVCTGKTGHAEVVRVEFDHQELGLEDILEVFFRIHDPTQLNRQGPDVGSQYRSIVLYQDEEQRETIENFIERIEDSYEDSVVTEVQPLEEFYPAEEKHQDYFEKNPEDAYCNLHAKPKVEKVREMEK